MAPARPPSSSAKARFGNEVGFANPRPRHGKKERTAGKLPGFFLEKRAAKRNLAYCGLQPLRHGCKRGSNEIGRGKRAGGPWGWRRGPGVCETAGAGTL